VTNAADGIFKRKRRIFESVFFVYNSIMFKNDLVKKLAEFLTEIGLEIEFRKLDKETFLPGILIENGKMLVDEDKLVYPGDLLHEAGHLAAVPAHLRGQMSDEVVLPGFAPDPIETAAMAWSYAATLYLEIDPRIVFHQEGYMGKSESLLMAFQTGVYLGVNVLEEAKMTATGENAVKAGILPYPKMIKWLRG
jgi:hypothetical protein